MGSFGSNAVSPRTLSSSHLGKIISLEGIVTRCSLVRPKVVKSVHYNEKKNQFVFREYRDQTMSSQAPTTSVYPQEDEEGRSLIYNLCSLSQQLTIDRKSIDHRIWFLQIPRPPNYLNTRNARKSTGWTASPKRGRNNGRRLSRQSQAR